MNSMQPFVVCSLNAWKLSGKFGIGSEIRLLQIYNGSKISFCCVRFVGEFMHYVIQIPCRGSLWCYSLLSYSDYQRIDCDGVVIFDIWKVHDHRYELRGFFYSRKVILSDCVYHTKKELYGAIQKFLQQYL